MKPLPLVLAALAFSGSMLESQAARNPGRPTRIWDRLLDSLADGGAVGAAPRIPQCEYPLSAPDSAVLIAGPKFPAAAVEVWNGSAWITATPKAARPDTLALAIVGSDCSTFSLNWLYLQRGSRFVRVSGKQLLDRFFDPDGIVFIQARDTITRNYGPLSYKRPPTETRAYLLNDASRRDSVRRAAARAAVRAKEARERAAVRASEVREERRARYRALGWEELRINQILARKVGIGMTPEMVLASWGKPDRIHETISRDRRSEMWVYESQSQYLYFVDGFLETISSH